MPDDEGRWIRRARAGDQAALVEIYRRHYDAVYAYVYYRLGDPAVAEDLAGEVFVRLVERISSYSDRGRPILAWLYTIARNLVVDHQRRAGRDADLPAEESPAPAPSDPAQAVERTLAQECLGRALRRLKDSYRQVILLRFVQDLSHAETAAILGKTEGATKVLQHRALQALRQALEVEGCYER